MQSNAAQVQRLMQLSAFAGRIMCDAYQAGNRHRAYHFMRKMYHFTKQARLHWFHFCQSKEQGKKIPALTVR